MTAWTSRDGGEADGQLVEEAVLDELTLQLIGSEQTKQTMDLKTKKKTSDRPIRTFGSDLD